MARMFFNVHLKTTHYRWICFTLAILSSIVMWGQSGTNKVVEELTNHGFENVRWSENESECIYSIENNIYRSQGVGITQALNIIQKHGLPKDKRCKVIVTHLEMPELSLIYTPNECDTAETKNKLKWETSYVVDKSWNSIKKEKAKNSSRYKVDILVYPQLSFKNLIITQIYQVLFTLNPTIEISFWPGMKFTGQVVIPTYNDGYGYLQDKIHPGFITLSQRFRLPYNIKGKATIGYFNADRYGVDFMLFYPFRNEQFSLEGRIGATAIGYWDGFRIHYDTDFSVTWTLGGNFYWPQYNTTFSLKGEQYLMKEKGMKFEMIRHFRYSSVGFYAQKARGVKSNGGFRIQVLLPLYKYKRFKNKYIPRLNTSNNMGIVYNAGNERYYYRQYKSEADENIMNNNRFNPHFIKSELLNNY